MRPACHGYSEDADHWHDIARSAQTTSSTNKPNQPREYNSLHANEAEASRRVMPPSANPSIDSVAWASSKLLSFGFNTVIGTSGEVFHPVSKIAHPNSTARPLTRHECSVMRTLAQRWRVHISQSYHLLESYRSIYDFARSGLKDQFLRTQEPHTNKMTTTTATQVPPGTKLASISFHPHLIKTIGHLPVHRLPDQYFFADLDDLVIYRHKTLGEQCGNSPGKTEYQWRIEFKQSSACPFLACDRDIISRSVLIREHEKEFVRVWPPKRTGSIRAGVEKVRKWFGGVLGRNSAAEEDREQSSIEMLEKALPVGQNSGDLGAAAPISLGWALTSPTYHVWPTFSPGPWDP
ncbi:hypothetical protein CERZMDRAFT_103174 [Cercospora zeae-maydis SCOH1-5]|uniref:Uncharacterized protein n=1 Tax=Cercospora zeae-maydis SCOH1-5 TaxID=717836 RepID=A0A6A6EYU8_9PEZI|nr:hypothetical protein CERZMDRAFT_103174 [Cercospora zeae-maydis SCOH1-5]